MPRRRASGAYTEQHCLITSERVYGKPSVASVIWKKTSSCKRVGGVSVAHVISYPVYVDDSERMPRIVGVTDSF